MILRIVDMRIRNIERLTRHLPLVILVAFVFASLNRGVLECLETTWGAAALLSAIAISCLSIWVRTMKNHRNLTRKKDGDYDS